MEGNAGILVILFYIQYRDEIIFRPPVNVPSAVLGCVLVGRARAVWDVGCMGTLIYTWSSHVHGVRAGGQCLSL